MYYKNKPKTPQFLIKLLLSLAIIFISVILGIVSYNTFCHDFSAIGGSIGVIILLGLLIWLIYFVNRKYKHTKPSFYLILFSLIVIFAITAFAGVQPMADYKNNTINWFNSTFHSNITNSSTITINNPFPYGKYIHTLGALEDIFVFNQDGTYQESQYYTGWVSESIQDVGHFKINSNFISFTSEQVLKSQSIQFRYSQDFRCLYLYKDYLGEYPAAFYLQ